MKRRNDWKIYLGIVLVVAVILVIIPFRNNLSLSPTVNEACPAITMTQAPSSCLDSDGNDIFNKGYIEFKFGLQEAPTASASSVTGAAVRGTNVQSSKYWDACSSKAKVCELGCNGKMPKTQVASCPNGYYCDDGKCIQKVCGNNISENGEECDGTSLNGQTCESLGYDSGNLSCSLNCTYSFGGCSGSSEVGCGNNITDGNEVCDWDDLNGQTCRSLGYLGGALSCNDNCSGFDISPCTKCIPGNGNCNQTLGLKCKFDGRCVLNEQIVPHFKAYLLINKDLQTGEETWREVNLETETVDVGSKLKLDASSTTGPVANFEWSFGDGGWGLNATEIHQFTKNSTISLTVYSEDWNQYSTISQPIHVASTMWKLGSGSTNNLIHYAMAIDERGIAWVSYSSEGKISVLNVSNPSSIQLITKTDFPLAWAMSSSNGLLYLARGQYGLETYSTTLPNPTYIGNYDVGNQVSNVASFGKVVILNEGTLGLKFLDMSNPSSPQLIGQLNVSLANGNIRISNGILYVVGYNYNVYLINVSTLDIWHPTVFTPVVLSSVSTFYPQLIDAKDNVLAVTAFNSGIEFYDVSNPRNPVFVSNMTFGMYGIHPAPWLPMGIVIVDNKLYAAFPNVNYASTDKTPNIARIDVADPSKPFVMEWFIRNESAAGNNLNLPYYRNGVIRWMNSIYDVETTRVAETSP